MEAIRIMRTMMMMTITMAPAWRPRPPPSFLLLLTPGLLLLPLLPLMLIIILPLLGTAGATSTGIHMIMEYSTDGTVLLNHANFTIRTVSMNVTLLGCDSGYYDHYLLYPPAVRTPRMLVTPFDCRECICSDFERERAEPFFS